jgi:hypothetical protein
LPCSALACGAELLALGVVTRAANRTLQSVAHSTDARPTYRAIEKLVDQAKGEGV